MCGAVMMWAQADSAYVRVSEADEPMCTGRFAPEWESLRQYETPQWFADAKFGIWAHWGPQCVEGSGDWMARGLYQEGSKQYKYHAEHYGHPSEVGFKDILPLFKAERWNPDSLVALYKSIGAQYFFVLGNHHDNFDLWNSTYQPWNSVNIGPKRDILAEWAAAAKKYELPFGVSLHADHAWTWYEPARRYDRNGAKAGVPYDGTLTAADGKGKWWEGLDPQQLYAQNHPASRATWSDGAIHRQWAWGDGAALPSQEFVTNVYNRTLEVINRYNPDLLYFDVTAVPFYPVSDAGLKIAAHFYNHYMATHGGKLDAVMFGKILTDEQKECLVWDVERGAPNEIVPSPWQSCSCIGGWHYNTDIYEKGRYKSAETVVRLLADIVSKNGCLLLNIPLRGDGTFDEKENAVLHGIGDWLAVNGEAIFATRPWKVFGEGPVAEAKIELKAQGFNEGEYAKMKEQEVRFTSKGKDLYAILLTRPEDGRVVIKNLASGSQHYRGSIKKVELLGHGRLPYKRTAEGLEVEIPASAPAIAVLKVR